MIMKVTKILHNENYILDFILEGVATFNWIIDYLMDI